MCVTTAGSGECNKYHPVRGTQTQVEQTKQRPVNDVQRSVEPGVQAKMVCVLQRGRQRIRGSSCRTAGKGTLEVVVRRRCACGVTRRQSGKAEEQMRSDRPDNGRATRPEPLIYGHDEEEFRHAATPRGSACASCHAAIDATTQRRRRFCCYAFRRIPLMPSATPPFFAFH